MKLCVVAALVVGTVSSFQNPSPRRQPTLFLSSTPLQSADSFDDTCDILVLGSGPAARSIASLLAAGDETLDVLLSDQNADREWPPNYGVWKDEWQAIVDKYAQAGVSLDGGSSEADSIDREWSVTDCFFGGSFDIPTTERMRLDRPYCRVDRFALRRALTDNVSYRVTKANHVSQAINLNLYAPAGSLVHDEEGTTIQLQTADDKILTVRSKLVVDCTGHETKLIVKESREGTQNPPGFQIAYGVLVDVDETNVDDISQVGPYAKEAMTLFDYRTDHFDDDSKAAAAPTFMYAMPLKENQIFFEETSLVARPAISFQECKERCIRRLAHHDIRVTAVHEEEYCYIPMGGALPARDQRILALGGAASMVHPSTGYHLCRCMMGAADMAKAIKEELALEKPNLDRAAASAYHALWSPENIRQRNFAVFGGEYLMKKDVVGLRGFFDGFFRLPLELWGGFLAGWPGLPNNDKHETWLARMWFGVNFLTKLPPQVAVDMTFNILQYMVVEGVPLPQSVTPFLGAPNSYEYKPNRDAIGDVAAKQEARKMIQSSRVTEGLPVAFDGSAGTADVAATDLVTDGSEFTLYKAGSVAEKASEPVVVVDEKKVEPVVEVKDSMPVTVKEKQPRSVVAADESTIETETEASLESVKEPDAAKEPTDAPVEDAVTAKIKDAVFPGVVNGGATKTKKEHDFDDVRRKNLKPPKGSSDKGFGSSNK